MSSCAHKNMQKSLDIFKSSILNVLSTGTNIAKMYGFPSVPLYGPCIVVKFTAAIFFPMQDCVCFCYRLSDVIKTGYVRSHVCLTVPLKFPRHSKCTDCT